MALFSSGQACQSCPVALIRSLDRNATSRLQSRRLCESVGNNVYAPIMGHRRRGNVSSNLRTGASVLALAAAASLFTSAAAAQTQGASSAGRRRARRGRRHRLQHPRRGRGRLEPGLRRPGADRRRPPPSTRRSWSTPSPRSPTPVQRRRARTRFAYYTPHHPLPRRLSASNTTLVLIDGMRMVGGGTQYAADRPEHRPDRPPFSGSKCSPTAPPRSTAPTPSPA